MLQTTYQPAVRESNYPLVQVPLLSRGQCLRRGLVGNRLGSDEVVHKTPRIAVEQIPDSRRTGRLHDESGVMIFLHAIDDFRIVVGRGVGMFLFCERDDYAGVVFTRGRKSVRILTCA